MLDYEKFKEIVIMDLPNYFPDNFPDVQFEIKKERRVNVECELLKLKQGIRAGNVEPALYLQEWYERYMAEGDMERILKEMEVVFENCVQIKKYNPFPVEEILRNPDDRIMFQLINTEQNRQLLEGVPHREFCDLSIIYRVVVDKSLEGLASYIISEDMAKRMGKREEELFGLAAENMKHLFPVQILPAHDALMMVLEDQEAPEWVLDVGRMVEEGAPKLYVITNNAHMNGASAILYEEGLHELAEKLEDDLYLLPSSIHEMIAVSASSFPVEDLAQIVYEANQSVVCLGERLSNEVYRYDRRLRTIEAAANTPYKRLDDMEQRYDKEYAIARNKEWKASVIEEEGQAPRVELTELNLNESRQRGSR